MVAHRHSRHKRHRTRDCGGQFHDQSSHARQYVIFYRKKPPCMGPESVPIAHSSLPVRDQLPLSLTGCNPCRVVSRTCVEVALKTSSTLFSIEELRKRQVRVKAPQRSFLLHHKSADRANLATFRGISAERSVMPGPSSEASSILGLLLASVRVTASLQA